MMNRLFLSGFAQWNLMIAIFVCLLHAGKCQAQSDSTGNSAICKQLAIQSAQSADRSHDYSQRIYFESRPDLIKQDADTALLLIQESIAYIDSALLLASDSAIMAKKYANIARDFAIDSYRALMRLKKSDSYFLKKEFSKEATVYSKNATVDAYHASFYFIDRKKEKKKESLPDTVIPEKPITKLDIDQTLFTLLKVDINEKTEANKQEMAKLSTELANTKDDAKTTKLKAQLKVLETKSKDLDKKNTDAQQKLSMINTQIEERDKNAVVTAAVIQKDTVFSKSTKKTTDEWNQQIKSDTEIPGTLVYQVQLGIYKAAVLPETFKGLTPIYSKPTDKGICYTTGLFERLADAREANNTVHEMGLKDAFIVAYYNKKKITLAEAAKLEKK